MPKFTIRWNASYTAEVEAKTKEEAEILAEDLEVNVKGSEYVDDTFTIERISENSY